MAAITGPQPRGSYVAIIIEVSYIEKVTWVWVAGQTCPTVVLIQVTGVHLGGHDHRCKTRVFIVRRSKMMYCSGYFVGHTIDFVCRFDGWALIELRNHAFSLPKSVPRHEYI